MASTSREKMAPKPVVFKFQGVLSKSMFNDDHVEIKDINLGHTDLGEILRLCNQPTKKFDIISTLI